MRGSCFKCLKAEPLWTDDLCLVCYSEGFGRALTPRQAEVVRIVRDFRKANGVSPSFQEIAALLGIAGQINAVALHFKAIARKGWLTRRTFQARTAVIHDPPRVGYLLALPKGHNSAEVHHLSDDEGQALLERLLREEPA